LRALQKWRAFLLTASRAYTLTILVIESIVLSKNLNSLMGWVYVLLNPSMEGIYKVGMTDRTPEERARELSASTSIATPFFVIYKHQTHYPKELEHAVHKELENSNSRINYNREFFEGDPSVAIRLIIRIANESTFTDLNGNTKAEQDPWIIFEKEGFEYLNGHGKKLRDRVKAEELFKKAEKLGSHQASLELIKMKEPGASKKNSSIKKLNMLREAGEIEASFLLFLYYESLDEVQNCITLLTEIINNSHQTTKEIFEHSVHSLAKISVMNCSAYGYNHEFSDREPISLDQSQSIISFLSKYQDIIISEYLKVLKSLRGESAWRYEPYLLDISVNSVLGNIYNNERLIDLGYNLSTEEIQTLSEYETISRTTEICKHLEKTNRKFI